MIIDNLQPGVLASRVTEAYSSLKRRCPLRIKQKFTVDASLYNRNIPSKPIIKLLADDECDVSLVDVLLIVAAVLIVIGALHSLSYKRR